MKINVGGEYILNSEKLISFFEYKEFDNKEDVVTYLGKYFLYSKSEITGEKTYENTYIFYSEKQKSIVYSVQRNNFILDSEFDVNINFINFKSNKIFANNKSFKNHKKGHKLHTIWIDEDDYLNNKSIVDDIYKNAS